VGLVVEMHPNTEYIWSRSDAVPHMSIGSLRSSIDSEETNTVSPRFMLHTMEIDQIFGLLAYLQNFHGLSWWTVDVARGQKQSDIQPQLLRSELDAIQRLRDQLPRIWPLLAIIFYVRCK
jgi:hypothetical protein